MTLVSTPEFQLFSGQSKSLDKCILYCKVCGKRCKSHPNKEQDTSLLWRIAAQILGSESYRTWTVYRESSNGSERQQQSKKQNQCFGTESHRTRIVYGESSNDSERQQPSKKKNQSLGCILQQNCGENGIGFDHKEIILPPKAQRKPW